MNRLLLAGLGGSELLIVIIVLLGVPVLISVISYRVGKKAGYNKAKVEAYDKLNK